MNVLVTGGAGFSGAHLVEPLLHRGDAGTLTELFAVQRFDTIIHRAARQSTSRMASRTS